MAMPGPCRAMCMPFPLASQCESGSMHASPRCCPGLPSLVIETQLKQRCARLRRHQAPTRRHCCFKRRTAADTHVCAQPLAVTSCEALLLTGGQQGAETWTASMHGSRWDGSQVFTLHSRLRHCKGGECWPLDQFGLPWEAAGEQLGDPLLILGVRESRSETGADASA